LHFEYYYFFNFLTLFSAALLVYIIVKRVFPGQPWIASLVALTYMIYPVDYTRTWFIMIYIRFWWLVSLGVIWLLLKYVSSGKTWVYLLAMSGIAFPLGAYEGQLGILLLTSILIAIFSIHKPVKRRVVIPVGVFGIGFGFLFWRTYLQEKFYEINDAYVQTLQFNPAILVERFVHGLYIFFIGWLEPIQDQLRAMNFNFVPWLLLYIVICFAIILWISSREFQIADQKISIVKTYLVIFMAGLAFWFAGYIPIIALYSPMLRGMGSRVNLFAIPGAALMLVSGLAMIATFITNSILIQRFTLFAMILPFVIASVFVQLQINRENQIAWETQKKIWNDLFATVPNIQDQKSVVIIIPGYEQLRPFQSYPFLSSWEIEAGAQVLYNNPKIGGNYYYKDVQPTELLFTKNGFRPIPTDKIIPYKRLIFVYYEPKSGAVNLVKNLEDALSLPFSVNYYHPLENIISAKPSTAKFRWLVE
jgi:hypothetical protein